eukprot:1359908-Amorphochlora_amoeboformis.AAC.1
MGYVSGGTVEKLMVFACGAGAISLGIPVIVTDHTLQLISFCVFETCVGVFWPTASSLRSMYFPEDTRASVMATLRVPQNILIMSVLFMGYQCMGTEIDCVRRGYLGTVDDFVTWCDVTLCHASSKLRYYRVLLAITRYYRVLPATTQYYRGLPVTTRYYRLLPATTGAT